MSRRTFIGLLAAGEARPEGILDHVEEWHDRYDGPLELHEFLGMTEPEYDRWMRDPKALETILEARRSGRPSAGRGVREARRVGDRIH